MRHVIVGVMALALASTILAGDGVVLVPHGHGPATPLDHPHGLALYRFPIALLGEPADAPRAVDDPATGPSFRLATPAAETLLGVSLILVAAVVVRAVAARPGRVAHVTAVGAPIEPQWSPLAPTGPPRRALLPA